MTKTKREEAADYCAQRAEYILAAPFLDGLLPPAPSAAYCAAGFCAEFFCTDFWDAEVWIEASSLLRDGWMPGDGIEWAS